MDEKITKARALKEFVVKTQDTLQEHIKQAELSPKLYANDWASCVVMLHGHILSNTRGNFQTFEKKTVHAGAVHIVEHYLYDLYTDAADATLATGEKGIFTTLRQLYACDAPAYYYNSTFREMIRALAEKFVDTWVKTGEMQFIPLNKLSYMWEGKNFAKSKD